jgi:hypothetical protein
MLLMIPQPTATYPQPQKIKGRNQLELQPKKISGGDAGIRTPDTADMSRML